eukprot:1062668-Rhodomonas_salina.1
MIVGSAAEGRPMPACQRASLHAHVTISLHDARLAGPVGVEVWPLEVPAERAAVRDQELRGGRQRTREAGTRGSGKERGGRMEGGGGRREEGGGRKERGGGRRASVRD